MGLRHPDIYGAVLCASPGAGFGPPVVMPSPLPRAYLTERVGSHGGAFWKEELPLMVAWAFGR